MDNQIESALATPAGQLKHDLLNDAALRRRQTERDNEAEPKLTEVPAQAMPTWRSSTAPTWSALHD